MPAIDRVRIARETYGAYESGDRGMVEKHLSRDFRFYSPADVGIDLSAYWTRCWPNAEARYPGLPAKTCIDCRWRVFTWNGPWSNCSPHVFPRAKNRKSA